MEQELDHLPLRVLLSRLSLEVRQIIRADIAFFKTEMRAKVASVKSGMIFIAAGAFIMLTGVLALVATLIIALSNVLPAWLSALVVGLFLLILGGSGALLGMKRMKETEWAPTQTAQILKEEKSWLREKLA